VFGIVRTGDVIAFDVEKLYLGLEIGDEEIRRRVDERVMLNKEREVSKPKRIVRGYRGLYERCVNQAEEGADFDFLTATGK